MEHFIEPRRNGSIFEKTPMTNVPSRQTMENQGEIMKKLDLAILIAVALLFVSVVSLRAQEHAHEHAHPTAEGKMNGEHDAAQHKEMEMQGMFGQYGMAREA